jgi:hypothetical protein
MRSAENEKINEDSEIRNRQSEIKERGRRA